MNLLIVLKWKGSEMQTNVIDFPKGNKHMQNFLWAVVEYNVSTGEETYVGYSESQEEIIAMWQGVTWKYSQDQDEFWHSIRKVAKKSPL